MPRDIHSCKAEALKHQSITDWARADYTGYSRARRMGWLKECSSHMKRKDYTARKTWTKEDCIQDARQYSKRGHWHDVSTSAYKAALKNGWLDEATSHMEKVARWDKENILEEAKRYQTATEWRTESPKSYNAAALRGILPECTQHMGGRRKTGKPIVWTKEKCIEKASEFSKIHDWWLKSPTSLQAAKKYGWFDECVQHIDKGRFSRTTVKSDLANKKPSATVIPLPVLQKKSA